MSVAYTELRLKTKHHAKISFSKSSVSGCYRYAGRVLSLLPAKGGYPAAMGSCRNSLCQGIYTIYIPPDGHTAIRSYYRMAVYHTLNMYLTMNYRIIDGNTANGIFTVSEVKISYQPKVRPSDRLKITCSNDIYKLLTEYGVFDPEVIEHREFFKLLLLNGGNRLLGINHLSEGGIGEVTVDVRHIMQAAILANATGIVLCHNHPSGNLKPSAADDKMTEKVRAACKLFGISLTDHLVISSESYYSYADEGRIL
ncbi:JAB domain-containing protein [Dysgonomonas reticulitermitis]